MGLGKGEVQILARVPKGQKDGDPETWKGHREGGTGKERK